MNEHWSALDRELGHWAELGRMADLWVRDDDASRDGPALRRLKTLASDHGVPILLAVIPARLDASLHDALDGWTGCRVGVHGFAHQSHALPGAKKAEFGRSDDVETRIGELAVGTSTLRDAFADRFVPAFVPPWNRVHDDVVAALPTAGLRGLSTFKPRRSVTPATGVTQVNTHVDIIDWRGTRGFVGEAEALGVLVQHLRERRGALANGNGTTGEEPTGILTHHVNHDAPCDRFLANLFTFVAGRDDVRWREVEALFP